MVLSMPGKKHGGATSLRRAVASVAFARGLAAGDDERRPCRDGPLRNGVPSASRDRVAEHRRVRLSIQPVAADNVVRTWLDEVRQFPQQLIAERGYFDSVLDIAEDRQR